jgi:geranylgeranyl pyrophosphate synthase
MSESVSLPSLDWSLEYFDAINAEIDSVSSDNSSGFETLVHESLAGGRRTRALLTMLWCEAVSGDYKPATPIAAAYEMAHAAALIEDDIIDGSSRKMGEETFPAKYGSSKAILVSNALLFYAPSFLARCARAGIQTSTLERLLELFGKCGRLTAKGEFLDLEMSEMFDVPESLYEKMISMKTGALVGASSASGAVVGRLNYDATVVDAAYSFGESLGMAYQIGDDLQDYFGDDSNSGKAVFWDLKSGKKSLPLIHALKLASKEERDFVKLILQNPESLSSDDSNHVKALMTKYDSQGYCQQSAQKFVRKAALSLAILEASNAKDRLLEVVQYLSTKN